MNLVHPKHHLPPLPAQAPTHQAPAHHAPAPAKAAAHCAPAPHAAAPAPHSAAPHSAVPAPAPEPRSLSGFLHNVPGSLKSTGQGILGIPKMLWDTGGDIGTSLSDGIDSAYNRAYGDKNIADADDKEAKQADARTREKLLNLVPFGGSHGGIAHYGEAFGDWATSLSLPPDQAAAMRQEGGAALHRANQYIEDMAYKDPAGFALNVLPLAAVGRAAALGRIGKLADGAEAGARTAGAAGDTAKAARLSEQAARYRQAINLARGGKAGAALREAKAQAASKLSAGSKATLAKAQAAAAKRRDHKLNAQRMAAPGKLREKWDKQGGGSGGQGQPALAGVTGGGGGGTKAIGKPNASKNEPAQMRSSGATGSAGSTVGGHPVPAGVSPARYEALGRDPAIGGAFRVNEADTALRVEAQEGITLERYHPPSGQKGDWIDRAPGNVYDGCSPTKAPYFDQQMKNGGYNKSLLKHVNNPSVDRVVVDTHDLSLAPSEEARLDAELSSLTPAQQTKIVRVR